ncbi:MULTISPECIES: CbtA family protein [Streptomyces]|uniref:CbtA family protein n=1 Tax=Streptomyces TaxID=1883 RepID=UPI0004BD9568|nr:MULTISPECIES: CbtA family protein [Streptomyces]
MHAATVRKLLVRGMIAGLLAGLMAFAVAYVIGEPSVRSSIALEEAEAAPAAGHGQHGGGDAAAAPAPAAEEEELVSRPVQSTFGLATGTLVYGVALGGIASLAFSFALNRIGRFSPRATATLTAAGVFTTVYLVPFLKYPATPPAVGNPDTIGKRTTLFFLMILLSVLLGLGAVIVGRRLAPRLGNWNATVAAGLGFAAAVTLAFVFLPPNGDAVRESFPAALLWEFRMASLTVQAVLWVAFGLIFGALAARVLEARATATDDSPAAEAVAASAA